MHSAFTLRKISNGVGVERVFQTHSPVVDSITVKRKGAVRKAKLYYLRERSGKSARIKSVGRIIRKIKKAWFSKPFLFLSAVRIKTAS